WKARERWFIRGVRCCGWGQKEGALVVNLKRVPCAGKRYQSQFRVWTAMCCGEAIAREEEGR
ncbi:hypothetical protein, partial [Lentibacter algarum]|uniref:hypothetical protein n=1 Tax=Lentibacter algarum TaxID=576131 RepID=UPI0030FCA273